MIWYNLRTTIDRDIIIVEEHCGSEVKLYSTPYKRRKIALISRYLAFLDHMDIPIEVGPNEEFFEALQRQRRKIRKRGGYYWYKKESYIPICSHTWIVKCTKEDRDSFPPGFVKWFNDISIAEYFNAAMYMNLFVFGSFIEYYKMISTPVLKELE